MKGEEQTKQETMGHPEGQAFFVTDVPKAILFAIHLLIELAWQKMGLHLNPVTHQIERDFRQARLAIDTVALLIEMVRGDISDREYEGLRTSLANLRLNFTEQVRREGQEKESPSPT